MTIAVDMGCKATKNKQKYENIQTYKRKYQYFNYPYFERIPAVHGTSNLLGLTVFKFVKMLPIFKKKMNVFFQAK